MVSVIRVGGYQWNLIAPGTFPLENADFSFMYMCNQVFNQLLTRAHVQAGKVMEWSGWVKAEIFTQSDASPCLNQKSSKKYSVEVYTSHFSPNIFLILTVCAVKRPLLCLSDFHCTASLPTHTHKQKKNTVKISPEYVQGRVKKQSLNCCMYIQIEMTHVS